MTGTTGTASATASLLYAIRTAERLATVASTAVPKATVQESETA